MNEERRGGGEIEREKEKVTKKNLNVFYFNKFQVNFLKIRKSGMKRSQSKLYRKHQHN